jgi:hypothetical protein
VNFEGQPLIRYLEFLLELVDNTFADVAERSDIVGINRHIDGFHVQSLVECLSWFG